jgi:hypothetical protein
VRAYAQSIGHELGLGRRELDLLNWAALLHDIGKLDVPHEILAKTGRPTPEEWELLRGHPAAGAKLAEPLRAWLGEWSAAIVEHHERWDGQGYPRGLAGDEISLAGRIVAVADVFDVITSTRSYKPSSSVAEARQELARCAGTQFDPEVVRALLSISVRQGRLAAPLAWAAHAAALVRLPATQAANGLSAGAAAVAVGVGVGIGAAIPPQRPVAAPPISPALRHAAPQVAHPAIVSHRPAKPGARPRLVRITPAAHMRRPVVATRRVAPVDPVENAAPAAQPSPSPPVQRPEPPAAAPEHAPAPRTARPPAAPAAVPAPKPASAREPVAPAPVSAVPAAAVPPPAETAAPLTGKVSEVTGDVASLTDDVASVADPSTPLDDDVSSVLDDVGSLTGHVTSLLLPPPPAASPSPPQAPSPSPDAPAPAQQGSGSVVDQAVSLLGGLGK